jgi:Protein of unknown function (DUF2934)
MSNQFLELTQEMQTRIRELAYLMWESAGRQQGMAMDYWLKAENEVLSTLQAAAARIMPPTQTATKESGEAGPTAAIAALENAIAPTPVAAPGVKDATPTSEEGAPAEALAPAAAKTTTRKPPTRAKTKA